MKKEHFVAFHIFQEKIAAFLKKKPLGENFGHSFSFGANVFCQIFTVWTIVYKKKVSSINLRTLPSDAASIKQW
jgi:hypothetical protein